MLHGSFAITSSFGYQRFCSNYLATRKEGFDREILFTNEETPDFVFRRELSWPPPIDDPAAEEAGLVVALDVKSGRHKPIYGMGRHNHENSVAIPGYRKPVVLSGDDTFTSGPLTGVFPAGAVPAQSQLYSYIARSTKTLLADKGDLWAFVSDTPGVRNYYDVLPNSGMEVKGHFIKVPKDIATGRNADGSEMRADDKGYPAPPNNGSWQSDLRSRRRRLTRGHRRPAVGARVLERHQQRLPVRPRRGHRLRQAARDGERRLRGRLRPRPDGGTEPGHAELPVHQRPRLEDGPRPQRPTEGDVADRARGGRRHPGQDADRGSSAGQHRVDAKRHPAHRGSGLEPAVSAQRYAPARPDPPDPNATTARLWFVPFSGTPEIVAKVDQSADGGPTDVDGRAPGNWGAWESSGIVDASAAFGRGAFLIDVQAHTLWIEKRPGDDNWNGGPPTVSPTSRTSEKAGSWRCSGFRATRTAENGTGRPSGRPVSGRLLARRAIVAGEDARAVDDQPPRPQPAQAEAELAEGDQRDLVVPQ